MPRTNAAESDTLEAVRLSPREALATRRLTSDRHSSLEAEVSGVRARGGKKVPGRAGQRCEKQVSCIHVCTPLSCVCTPATQGTTELRNVGAAHPGPNAHRAPRAAVDVAGTVHAPRTVDTPHTVHCATRVHRSVREARRAQVNPLPQVNPSPDPARQLVSDLAIFRNRLDDAQERTCPRPHSVRVELGRLRGLFPPLEAQQRVP